MYKILGYVQKLPVTTSVRTISRSTVNLDQNLYTILGLKASATQGDIKGAYYKLSKKFHPDKNDGCKEAADRFREVTDAYEVLGNVKLRKLYDRGSLHRQPSGAPSPQPTPEPEGPLDRDTKQRFYAAYARYSHARQAASVAPTGNVYNLDEWTRSHYSASFVKGKEDLEQRDTLKSSQSSKGLGSIALIIAFFGATICLYQVTSAFEDRKLTAKNYQQTQKSFLSKEP